MGGSLRLRLLCLFAIILVAAGFAPSSRPFPVSSRKTNAAQVVCAMDNIDRRDALLGIAGLTLFGLNLPLRADAQLNVIKGVSKEKVEKKKGRVRYNNLGQPIDPEKERPKPVRIDLEEECAKDPNFCNGKGAWCSCANFKKNKGSDEN